MQPESADPLMWWWLERLGAVAPFIPHKGCNKEAMSRLIGGNAQLSPNKEVGIM